MQALDEEEEGENPCWDFSESQGDEIAETKSISGARGKKTRQEEEEKEKGLLALPEKMKPDWTLAKLYGAFRTYVIMTTEEIAAMTERQDALEESYAKLSTTVASSITTTNYTVVFLLSLISSFSYSPFSPPSFLQPWAREFLKESFLKHIYINPNMVIRARSFFQSRAENLTPDDLKKAFKSKKPSFISAVREVWGTGRITLAKDVRSALAVEFTKRFPNHRLLPLPGDDDLTPQNKWYKIFKSTAVSKVDMASPLLSKKDPIDEAYAAWLVAWGPCLREWTARNASKHHELAFTIIKKIAADKGWWFIPTNATAKQLKKLQVVSIFLVAHMVCAFVHFIFILLLAPLFIKIGPY